MNSLTITVICLATFAVNGAIAGVCNGIEGLCQLKFNEVTFAGTHNSGADRVMQYNAGLFMIPAMSCFYRNQDLNIAKQLDWGIRFFDIDTRSKGGVAYRSHNTAYGAKVSDAFNAITQYMNRADRRTAVVVLRFHDTTMGGKFSQIEKVFNEYLFKSGKVQANDQAEWPTLQQAVDANKRIFIFMVDELCDSSCRKSRPYIRPASKYGDTYMNRKVTTSCSGMVEETRSKCKSMTADLSLVSAFASEGLCVSEMQKKCNPWIKDSAMACFEERSKSGKTVNFLTADYINQASSTQNVVKVSNELNALNLQMRGY